MHSSLFFVCEKCRLLATLEVILVVTENTTAMRVNISYCIWEYEDITAEEISDLIGISPSKVFIKGMPMGSGAKILARNNAWIFESPAVIENQMATFDEQIAQLFKVLEGKKNILRELGEKYSCEISCGIYLDRKGRETPPTYFEERHVELMAFIKTALNFDIIM